MQERDRELDLSSVVSRLKNFKKELKSLGRAKTNGQNLIKKKIINALKKCIDPELGSNIVDLGFVYGITLTRLNRKYKAKIIVTLTSPFCPLSDYIVSQARESVAKVKGISNVEVEVTFEPQWTPAMISLELQKKLFKSFLSD
ncbi:MAG: metal-sulfur cluster assembly factor [Candidatus Micrarchaeota archaeon]|nr:metal-sulfur cluster assembly factor [Candidatus Micrarchaeota archaeon]